MARIAPEDPALWPVLLSLAAVRAGLGERAEALRLATAASFQSRRAGDELGLRRCRALVHRLAR